MSILKRQPRQENDLDDTYRSDDDGWTMKREEGLTPNGNELAGRWVLRHEGKWIDFDKYRTDLADRNGLDFFR